MKFGLQSTISKRISRRYAKALFNIALENKVIDVVNEDILFISETLQSSNDLDLFISDPHHSEALYSAVITDLFKVRINSETFNFLLFLIQKGRISILKEILKTFIRIYQTYYKIEKVQIISTEPLLPEQITAICKKLKIRWEKDFEAETSIDKTLIGGFKVKAGDKVLDFSMKNQLENFRRQVINA